MNNSPKIAAKEECWELKRFWKIYNGKLTVATALQDLSIYVIWQKLLWSHCHPDKLHIGGGVAQILQTIMIHYHK